MSPVELGNGGGGGGSQIMRRRESLVFLYDLCIVQYVLYWCYTCQTQNFKTCPVIYKLSTPLITETRGRIPLGKKKFESGSCM